MTPSSSAPAAGRRPLAQPYAERRPHPRELADRGRPLADRVPPHRGVAASGGGRRPGLPLHARRRVAAGCEAMPDPVAAHDRVGDLVGLPLVDIACRADPARELHAGALLQHVGHLVRYQVQRRRRRQHDVLPARVRLGTHRPRARLRVTTDVRAHGREIVRRPERRGQRLEVRHRRRRRREAPRRLCPHHLRIVPRPGELAAGRRQRDPVERIDRRRPLDRGLPCGHGHRDDRRRRPLDEPVGARVLAGRHPVGAHVGVDTRLASSNPVTRHDSPRYRAVRSRGITRRVCEVNIRT
jgi:hypothetical protein